MAADERVGRGVPWRYSLAYGAGAAVLCYACVVILLAVELVAMSRTVGGATGVALVSGTLGDFYAAHLGATTDLALGVRGVRTVPRSVYSLLPPVLLGWSGWQAARAAETSVSRRAAALSGASVVAGYLPAVGVSLAVLAAGFEGTVVGISPLRVLLVAGVVFPLVWGGLGGYVAGQRFRDEKP